MMQPDTEVKPVLNHFEILSLVHASGQNSGLGVNEIFNKTGSSNKPRITKLIHELEKCQLIASERSKQHKQKELKKLTTLGIELVEFRRAIERFNTAYSQLQRTFDKHYVLPPNSKEEVAKALLLQRGWKKDEIPYWDHRFETIRAIRTYSTSLFINSIISRYVSINMKYRLNLDAKNMLLRQLKEILDTQFKSLSSSIQDSRDIIKEYVINELLATINFPNFILTSSLIDAFNPSGSKKADIRFLLPETVNIVKTCFSIINLTENTIPRDVDIYSFKDFIDNLDLEKVSKARKKVLFNQELMEIDKINENHYTVTEEDGQVFNVRRAPSFNLSVKTGKSHIILGKIFHDETKSGFETFQKISKKDLEDYLTKGKKAVTEGDQYPKKILKEYNALNWDVSTDEEGFVKRVTWNTANEDIVSMLAQAISAIMIWILEKYGKLKPSDALSLEELKEGQE